MDKTNETQELLTEYLFGYGNVKFEKIQLIMSSSLVINFEDEASIIMTYEAVDEFVKLLSKGFSEFDNADVESPLVTGILYGQSTEFKLSRNPSRSAYLDFEFESCNDNNSGDIVLVCLHHDCFEDFISLVKQSKSMM